MGFFCCFPSSRALNDPHYNDSAPCSRFCAMAVISFVAFAAIALIFVLTEGYYFPPGAIGALAGGCGLAFIVGLVFLSLAISRRNSAYHHSTYHDQYHYSPYSHSITSSQPSFHNPGRY